MDVVKTKQRVRVGNFVIAANENNNKLKKIYAMSVVLEQHTPVHSWSNVATI